MVKDDLYISVPSYFRCPISLDVMKSPVSLCTGVTYDRISIQRWLDGGNNTCPATMQLLHNKDLIPNYTLQRLIKVWSDSILPPPPPLHSLTSDQAADIIRSLHTQLQTVVHNNNNKSNLFFNFSRDISRLTSFANESDDNARFLVASGGRILPSLVTLIGRVKDLSFLEKLLLFCNALLENHSEANALKSRTQSRNCDLKASILTALKQGRLELRIATVKFLYHLFSLSISVEDEDNNDDIYSEVLRLISSSDWNAAAMDASLSLLTRWGQLKRNRAKMVRAGGVRVLSAALSEAEMSAQSTEKVLKLLEMASGSKQGRNEICGDELCLRTIAKKVLKVSNAATEHAVTVVWSLCCVFGDKRAAAALVAQSSGMVAKILVLLQSNCSPAVRQMCADLLRVFRCGDKTTSCVSWYDTKTSHIMPF